MNSTIKVKREGGAYILTTPDGDTIRVFRQTYAFKLASRLVRDRGMRSKQITKAVAKQY